MGLYCKEVRGALLHVVCIYASVYNTLCNVIRFSVMYCHCQCYKVFII